MFYSFSIPRDSLDWAAQGRHGLEQLTSGATPPIPGGCGAFAPLLEGCAWHRARPTRMGGFRPAWCTTDKFSKPAGGLQGSAGWVRLPRRNGVVAVGSGPFPGCRGWCAREGIAPQSHVCALRALEAHHVGTASSQWRSDSTTLSSLCLAGANSTPFGHYILMMALS